MDTAVNASSYRHGLVVNTLAAFTGRGLAIVGGIILAKTMSPDLMGKFFADQALVLLGGGLINLGIGQGYRQIVSRNPALRTSYLLPTISLRVVMVLLYFAGLAAYLNYTGRISIQTLLVVAGTLLWSLLELLEIDLQILRNYIVVSVLIVSEGFVVFLSAVVCRQAGGAYNPLVVSYFVCVLLVVIIGWLMVRPPITSMLWPNYSRLIKTSIPFSAALIAYAFTSFWGLTYIRGVLGEQQAGYYCVPLKVYQLTLVLGMSVSGVTLPLYHQLAALKHFGTYSKIFSRLVRGMWFISGPIVAVCFFIPEFIIRVFASEKYMPAAAIFPWIGFAVVFRLLAIPAGNVFESVGRQWYRVAAQSIGAVICGLLVVLIVPKYGITGAAWTLFATDLWVMAAYWLIGSRIAPKVIALSELVVPGIVLLAMLLLCACPLNISMWLKLLVFVGLWTTYVMFFLDFKTEIFSLSKVFCHQK